jgi:putative transposase
MKYQSFTLKQGGYSTTGNRVTIGKQQYRLIEGNIKTLTIKRDALGDIYFVIVTGAEHQVIQAATTEIAGMDFVLKDFLIASDGSKVAFPAPLQPSLKKLKKANRSLFGKKKGSHNRAARVHLKTALDLARKYKAIAIGDLNLTGMPVGQKGLRPWLCHLRLGPWAPGRHEWLLRGQDRSLVSQQQDLPPLWKH